MRICQKVENIKMMDEKTFVQANVQIFAHFACVNFILTAIGLRHWMWFFTVGCGIFSTIFALVLYYKYCQFSGNERDDNLKGGIMVYKIMCVFHYLYLLGIVVEHNVIPVSMYEILAVVLIDIGLTVYVASAIVTLATICAYFKSGGYQHVKNQELDQI
jgi:hypothetical protein